jgi:alkanesulfonate monooxygenase SsuD/methylene tetrahydromethanopterin reductase-like flavin-dependent oxidoreductase (luciferase family)
MKLGVAPFELRTGHGPEIDPFIIPKMTTWAEERGFEYCALPDRVSRPTYRFDTLTLIAYLAAITTRIKFRPHVFILPLRQPIELARRVNSLDWLSQGRFIFEVGVGGAATAKQESDTSVYRKEFVDVGIPHSQRGARTNEVLEALLALWTQEKATYAGRYYQFENVEFRPTPFTKPHVPIWVGGFSDAAVKRAARYGSGFSPGHKALSVMGGPAAVRDAVRQERLRCAEAGIPTVDGPDDRVHVSTCLKVNINDDPARAAAEAEVFWAEQRGSVQGAEPFTVKVQEDIYGPPGAVADRMEELRETGIDSLDIHFQGYNQMEQLHRMDEVISRLSWDPLA